MTTKPKKVNYLNNKDILKEIHNSKGTYSYIEDEKYSQIDAITDTLEEIFSKVDDAKASKASRLQTEAYAQAMKVHNEEALAGAKNVNYRTKPKQKDFAVDLDSLMVDELVFRVMTFDHIPEEPGRKKNPKTVADTKAKLNFPPYKQYIITNLEQKQVREVGRSHWTGDLTTGEFSVDHGRITNKLGTMYLKLVERYSHRANWRGYTYVDEMRGQALVQLSYMGLQFNEARSDNPFAYYTQTITNSFTRILNLEKKNQTIRDDILIDQGHLPSYTRQLKHEEELKKLRETSTQEHSDDIEAFGDL